MAQPQDLRGSTAQPDLHDLPLTPRQRYRADLARPGFAADPAQARAVEALQQVYDRLVQSPPKRRFGSARLSWSRVPGLYLWGGVGRGKTYLMDTFFGALPFSRKRRTHFHRFMLEVHERRNAYHGERDPLLRVAQDIAADVRVMCFDEFHVNDIADAMILGRLFEALFKLNLTLVTTSNVAPDLLYKDGLQRAQFLPAIERLKAHCGVLNVDGGVDHRLRALHGAELYLWPCDAAALARLGERFAAVSVHGVRDNVALEVNGRNITARRAAESAVWFEFEELCERPRGPADYIELGRTHDLVMISSVPQFNAERDDAARRFINLVDEFYDRGVKLLLGAAVPPEQLYTGVRLRFEFERTVSRLIEMQSHEYLARPHLP
ncbi:MAG: AFG1 family ATPase [Nevskia sp.]|nr:AFG1 family ATPase [Nevskia sp.]